MNCRCSSAVNFHLLNEVLLFSIFDNATSFQTSIKKNALETQTFVSQDQPSFLSLIYQNSTLKCLWLCILAFQSLNELRTDL